MNDLFTVFTYLSWTYKLMYENINSIQFWGSAPYACKKQNSLIQPSLFFSKNTFVMLGVLEDRIDPSLYKNRRKGNAQQ